MYKRLSRFFYHNRRRILLVLFLLVLLIFVFGSSSLLVLKDGLLVVREDESVRKVSDSLQEQGLLGNRLAFLMLYTIRSGFGIVEPGGYRISKEMTLFEVIQTLRRTPYLRWVSIPEGLRKEEIALILSKKLDWPQVRLGEFVDAYKTLGLQAREGVFYPDTYLLPIDEDGKEIAKRFVSRFNEQIGPLYSVMRKQNIKNDTALKLASIIQREAAGKEDMSLVSGILWNRLQKGMRLEVDATLQYARGDEGRGYWAPITPKHKNTYSPFNTYRYKGLPPTPISNPGLDAMRAAVFPLKTECLYYIHDSNRHIHCAKTYTEHKANIARYL